jgi:asparagine synthase (glutamine-hydrolysing)
MDEREAEGELDRLLRESMREHLRSDVPPGIWTNGGLDSSTLLHYGSELSSTKLKTFSFGAESKSARQVSEHYGTEHFAYELNTKSDLVPALEDLAYYSDEPGADPGALPLWFLSKMSRRHVTVALSGEGSDELFGGRPAYRADRLESALRWLPAGLRRRLPGRKIEGSPWSRSGGCCRTSARNGCSTCMRDCRTPKQQAL